MNTLTCGTYHVPPLRAELNAAYAAMDAWTRWRSHRQTHSARRKVTIDSSKFGHDHARRRHTAVAKNRAIKFLILY